MQRVKHQVGQNIREGLEVEVRTLFEAAPIGMCICNAEGRFLHVNAMFESILGYSQPALATLTFRDITYSDDLPESARVFNELVAGKRSTFDIQKRYRKQSGAIMWSQTSCAAVRDTDGTFVYTFAMIQDITEQREEENALHNLVAGTASVTGEEFFPELVKHLAAALGVRYALVSECAGGVDRVRSLAYWADNNWHSMIEYDVAGTTCEEVLTQGRMCYYPDHVQELFPQESDLVTMRATCYLGTPLFDLSGNTIGHIFVIDDKPLSNVERARSILAIFAARAAIELLRKRTEESLKNLVAGTASVTGEEFFPALVKYLAITLNVKQAVVAECVDPSYKHARPLAIWRDGAWVEGHVYATVNTPCSALLQSQGMCYYPDHVQQHFPGNTFLPSIGARCYLGAPLFDGAGHAIGHLYVVGSQPLADEAFAKSIVSIFAARAAMELQRKRAEAQIREQAMFLDKAHDAILVCTLDKCIAYWNQAAVRLYGWSREEALGKNVYDLLFDKEPRQHVAQQNTLDKGDWIGELHQVSKDGKELLVESRWTMMRDDDGNPRSILMMNIDITEKKRLEAHFLRAQRMESIGTLAGGIAHDLNNVLTPIMLAAETLQDRPVDERTRHLVEMIHANARRGADMANQVLAFARGVEGRRVAIDPKHLIREIEKIIKETFPKYITLTTRVARGIHAISADPTQMHQVLLNLALNARDAMPNGGTLRIAAENVQIDRQYAGMLNDAQPGEYVTLTVTDTGTGIKQSDLPKVFEPFFTTKEVGKGTGLGLSTVAGIIKSHGGFISVDSEIGKGSSFKLFVPAIPLENGTAKIEREELPAGNGECIMIVDDEASIRDMTGSTLQSYNYRVILAADGTEAVALYAQHAKEIAVVLTDLMMPFMDGAATIRALRKLNPGLRVIAASGLSGSVRNAEEVKVDAFLAKPYTVEKLLRAIRKVLEN